MNLTKKQEYELLAAISARGEIPVKFSYLDGGEQLWDEIYSERSEDGGMANTELNLLTSHLESFARVFTGAQGINLIDLGCGNGKPAIPILKELQKHNFKVFYTGVDISTDMLELAEKNLNKEFPNLPIEKLLIDFEKDSLSDELLSIKQQNNYPSLLLNFGNTLGNYVNTSSVLTNFLESMTLEDYLLVGNGLANDYNPQQILASYTEVVKNMVTRPAKLLGIYGDSDEFLWVWNNTKNRVEARIKLKAPKVIKLANQNINLQSGEELLVMRSNKYSEASLTKLLSEVASEQNYLQLQKTVMKSWQWSSQPAIASPDLSIIGVLKAKATAGVPLASLVAVGGNATVVFEHLSQVH